MSSSQGSSSPRVLIFLKTEEKDPLENQLLLPPPRLQISGVPPQTLPEPSWWGPSPQFLVQDALFFGSCQLLSQLLSLSQGHGVDDIGCHGLLLGARLWKGGPGVRLCLPKAGRERREPLTLPRPAQGAREARSKGRILCLLIPGNPTFPHPPPRRGDPPCLPKPLWSYFKNQTETKKTHTCTAQMSLQHCAHLLVPLTLPCSHTEAATSTAQA